MSEQFFLARGVSNSDGQKYFYRGKLICQLRGGNVPSVTTAFLLESVKVVLQGCFFLPIPVGVLELPTQFVSPSVCYTLLAR